MWGLDFLLVAAVIGVLPMIVWRPWLGVLVFAWLGYMNPHRLIGGVAFDLPLAKLVAIATLCGTLLTRQRFALPMRREVGLLAALFVTFLLSTALGAYEPQRAWSKLAEVAKIWLMTGLTLLLFQDRAKLRMLVLVTALSLGFLGAAGGMWGLSTGLESRLFGPPQSGLGDNNALGFALVMALPLLAYARQNETQAWLRALLLIAFGLSIVAVFATYSRGAFICLCVVLVLLAVQLRHRDRVLLYVIAAACLMTWFAPHQWVERIETITPSAHRTDASGAQRMKSWYVALRLGLDHPLLGAGFHPFSRPVYEHYLPGYSDDHDAHNHFLQVFAEHGFVGLLLFCALLISVAVRMWRLAHRGLDSWLASYAWMILMALVVFVVGGAFINLPYFDLYYELVAVAVILDELAAGEKRGGIADRKNHESAMAAEPRPAHPTQPIGVDVARLAGVAPS